MTQAFFVVNPAAGAGRTERLWRDLRDELTGLAFAFEWAPTSGPGNATELARAAVESGVTLVVSVGGDGTLNEVVTGVAGDDRPRATVGAILTGRGCDGTRNFGLAADPRLATRRIVEGVDTTIDLVRADWPGGGRRFVVGAAGAGFDAAVARRATGRRGQGTLPYLTAVVVSLATHAPEAATIDADGERVWSGPLSAAVVANGAHYGGGMKIAPAADPADGWLDLVVLGDLGRLELLRWLPTVYRGGHLANRKVVARTARRVTLQTPRPLPVHVDGEPAPPTPVTFSLLPAALRLRR